MILFVCRCCSMRYRAAERNHGRVCLCGGELVEWPEMRSFNG